MTAYTVTAARGTAGSQGPVRAPGAACKLEAARRATPPVTETRGARRRPGDRPAVTVVCVSHSESQCDQARRLSGAAGPGPRHRGRRALRRRCDGPAIAPPGLPAARAGSFSTCCVHRSILPAAPPPGRTVATPGPAWAPARPAALRCRTRSGSVTRSPGHPSVTV
eukprot:759935-Hanusia_phi.AAC.6